MKNFVSSLMIILLNGKSGKNGQDLGARVRASETKQKWGGWDTKEALGGEGKSFGRSREWTSFVDVLAVLVFGIVLFSNVDGLLDYMCAEKGKANWEELWAGMVGASVNCKMFLRNLFDSFYKTFFF